MYQQDTSFRAANTPLFSQLFGPSTGSVRRAPATRESRSVDAVYKHPCAHIPPPQSRQCIPAAQESYHAGAPLVLSGGKEKELKEEAVVPAAPKQPVSMVNEEGKKKEEKSDDDDVYTTTLKPAVPFRQVMGELERRFREQMAVHRELNTSMRHLDLLHREISLFRAERRTARLAAALCEESASVIGEAAVDSIAASVHTQQQQLLLLRQQPQQQKQREEAQQKSLESNSNNNNSGSTASPLLMKILKSYAEERSNNASRAEELMLTNSHKETKEKKKHPLCDVVRPPQEPRPYRRVFYVPVEKEPKERVRYDDDSSKVSAISNSITVPTAISYTEDLESSGGVSTDLSVATPSDSAGKSVATSAMSIKDDPNIRKPTSISKEMSVSRTTDSSSSVVGDDVGDGSSEKDSALLETLREFHHACGSANRLMQSLLGPDNTATQAGIKHRGVTGKIGALGTKSIAGVKDDKGENVWLTNLRRDVVDVRKLCRFIDHIKRNIKALDCQRKTQEMKRRLLIKAQRLARAHQQIRHKKRPLSDIMDDIVDLIKSDTNHSDGGGDNDIIDEVATATELSWGNISDEVVEDNVMDAENDSGVIDDDEVVDELDDEGAWKGDRDDFDVPEDDEVISELSWATAESDYANALLAASDIEDMVEDNVPLATDNEGDGEDIVEDIPPASSIGSQSTLREDIVEDMVDGGSGSAIITTSSSVLDIASEKLQRSLSTSFPVDEDVADSSVLQSSNPDDADVSSVLPATTRSGSVGEQPDDNRYHYDDHHAETDSAESALNALEYDMQEAQPRRVKSLLSVHPPTFTPLYTADAVDDVTATETCRPSPKQELNAEDVVAVDPPPPTTTRTAAAAGSGVRSVHEVSSSGNNEALEETTETLRSDNLSVYAVDDLLAQVEWKERQLALCRKLRPKTAWEQGKEKEEVEEEEEKKKPSTDKKKSLEESADYHWGMLETLLQSRFACPASELLEEQEEYYDDYDEDEDEEGVWSDRYDGDSSSAYSNSPSEGDAANVEYSP